jgi:hypothetical protein
MAKLGIYSGAAVTTTGGLAVAATAAIEVRRESDSGLASIYSDRAGASPISQPGFVADAQGRFIFYAAGIDGGYSVKVTAVNAETYTLRNQQVGLAQERDAGDAGAQALAGQNNVDCLVALGVEQVNERANRMRRLFAAQNLT